MWGCAMSDAKPDTRPMVPVGADPVFQSFFAKVRSWADAARDEHLARMASLPAGTCEICYGTGEMLGAGGYALPCRVCHPPQLHAVGVPYEFQTALLENFDRVRGTQTAVMSARAFLDGDRRDLYLWGGVGAGKTRLACSIANESFRRGRGGYFARVPMVLHRLQPGREADEREELERLLYSTPLLVLDDIGAERDQATDYTRRTLYMIYEERGDRGLRTVFTSNKALDDLSAMQDDDRLSSRIAGRAHVVELTAADQRLARRRQ